MLSGLAIDFGSGVPGFLAHPEAVAATAIERVTFNDFVAHRRRYTCHYVLLCADTVDEDRFGMFADLDRDIPAPRLASITDGSGLELFSRGIVQELVHGHMHEAEALARSLAFFARGCRRSHAFEVERSPIEAGYLLYEPRSRSLCNTVTAAEVTLTRSEAALFEALISRPNEAQSREVIKCAWHAATEISPFSNFDSSLLFLSRKMSKITARAAAIRTFGKTEIVLRL